MHEENLDKNKAFNYEKLETWESENEIKNYFINQAKHVHQQDQSLEAYGMAAQHQALVS